MEIRCADCSCVVDRGAILEPCAEYPACCCRELPVVSGVADSTPILPVRDIGEAGEFYESTGFDLRVYEGLSSRRSGPRARRS
jgi:hypothetical protein